MKTQELSGILRKIYPYREKEAAEQTIEEIKKILHERLPEHRHTLESLSYSKLSSLPALLAWQMNATEGEQRIIAAEEMDKQSGYMIPDHIRDDLPRKAEKWEEHDFQQVQAAAWESSYAQDFFPILEKHIHENFAKLIIDPLLIEFEGVVSPIIGQAERTCMIGIESANKKLEDIQEQLNIDYNVIDGELKVLHKDFMLLPNFIIESPENIDQLYNEKLPNSFKETEIYQDTQNRHRSILGNFGADTAKEKFSDAAQTSAADHNRITAVFFRKSNDSF